MRVAVILSGLALALAACGQTVPDSGAEATGVGFGSYNQYQAERAARETALASGVAPGGAVSGEPLSAVGPLAANSGAVQYPMTEAEALAAQTRATLGLNAVTSPATSQASAAAPTGASATVSATPTGRGLSDENDFAAVSERESIESDRLRLQQQRAEYEVVAPSDLPDRPDATGPNIVAFALSTSHAPGTKLYSRMTLFGSNGRNCNRYNSANEAQQAFLAAGGPDRDRQGLDPDGDGYACGWDPRPFRLAAASNN